MILRSGRFGKFLACSAYPNCKATLSVDKDGQPILPEVWPDPCPECGKEMIVRRGRRGRFVACTGYPECKKTLPYKKQEEEVASGASSEPQSS
jgi:DNA topoisomerase-1